jgi:hypothetical protein
MEISTDNGAEERIAALERKMRDMEALVRGLIAELLDMKTAAMAISRQDGDRSRQELKNGTAVRDTVSPVPPGPSASPFIPATATESTVIAAEGASQGNVPESAMVRIMQSDGTMKLEPRYGKKKMI